MSSFSFTLKLLSNALGSFRSSAGACPLLVVGQVCPQENPLYYFKCCGDLNASCCFRLQVRLV
ncbi:unnamed protein product [Haemonchus placei]|uniref:Secreted protein n=1 Tax=Haemonchus placei TaxID=6290 RepID=A0A0N4W8N8_HAEPC|nr:unnamed protein product [Haemonchus placei]